jgi:hypothetical protein
VVVEVLLQVVEPEVELVLEEELDEDDVEVLLLDLLELLEVEEVDEEELEEVPGVEVECEDELPPPVFAARKK